MPDTYNNILLIQTASIGDVILITPVIEGLHQKYPNSKIDILVKKGNESLFKGHPFINEVLIWNKSENKYQHLFSLLKRIRLNKYEWVINFQRFVSTGMLTAFSKAKRKTIFQKNPLSFLCNDVHHHIINNPQQSFHEVDRNLSLIQTANDVFERRPVLYPTIEDEHSVAEYKSHPYLCITPASLWFTKQFPLNKWCEFLNAIPRKLIVYLIGGIQDIDLMNNIIHEITNDNIKVINLAGSLSLLQTAALMKQAEMNFVNDSAPLHLASSVNAKTTALFCSTIPAFGFGPLAEDVIVIETKENLTCRPCGLHGLRQCPEKHFACAQTIQPKQLLQRI
ncbi:MAG: glycosyltransferase family 9 protein [Bacteroidota bacterium]